MALGINRNQGRISNKDFETRHNSNIERYKKEVTESISSYNTKIIDIKSAIKIYILTNLNIFSEIKKITYVYKPMITEINYLNIVDSNMILFNELSNYLNNSSFIKEDIVSFDSL